jgi:cyclopropane-fatty-acyl-phospholipid synthase
VIDRPPPSRVPADARLAGAARRLLVRMLASAARDPLVVEEAGRRRTFGPVDPSAASSDTTVPRVTIRDRRAWTAVAVSGSAGLGEGYFRGWWDCTDLVGLVRALIRATRGLDDLRNRWAALTGPVAEPLRRLRRPDPDRDRANIHAHYDVSNEFFALVLDPTMTYSCAVFEASDEPLEDAQRRKIDGWCATLGLGPGHQLVEIGSGWGALARRAAEHGAQVTTTTVSDAQHEWVTRVVADAGLADRVHVLSCDYRDLAGTFDRLCSIEMIEAVDWRDHDRYFQTVAGLLAPDGLAGIQAIVIDDRRYERAKRSRDFVKRWIFPDGCLPSVTAISESLARCTDLRIVGLRDIGAHYAETLARWRANLLAHADRLPALGLDDQFRRLFEFYLAYCEAAFRERHVSVVQLVLARPEWRGEIRPMPAVAATP